MSKFNYQRSFGLANIFLAICMQGLLLHQKMHGPEKIGLLQHIIKWKEKANFKQFDRGFFLAKKKNPSQQPHFICNLNHYFDERH